MAPGVFYGQSYLQFSYMHIHMHSNPLHFTFITGNVRYAKLSDKSYNWNTKPNCIRFTKYYLHTP